MNVNIDQARSYVQAGDIYHFSGFARGEVYGNRRDLSPGNPNVHDSVETIGGVNDVAAL
jgi:hypothetical protein